MLRVLAFVLLWPVTVSAQEADPNLDDAARTAFLAGQSAFEDGDFETALTAFQSGHDLSARPDFLFNIASCHDRLRHDQQALDHYQQYLAEMPDADNRDYVQSRIDTLHRESPAEPAPAPEEPSRVPALIAFGAGAAGAITFGTFAVLALSTHGEFSDCPANCGEIADRGETQSLIADIGLGVGVAGIAAGVLLWVLSEPSNETESVRLSPAIGVNQAHLVLEGRL